MKIYTNNIPSSHIQPLSKHAQVIPEQMITETVEIYEAAIQYLQCEIQSTIQHEAGHRRDEEERDLNMPFSEFATESRVEPIAENEEEECDSLRPTEVGSTISVNLNELFERAKSAAKINEIYKADIRAGTLDPKAQGMYLMQDAPQGIAVEQTGSNNKYQGFDGTLWIDVRKIVEPYIADHKVERQLQPSTFQDDGIHSDIPGVSQMSPDPSAIPAAPSVPAMQGLEAR